MMTDVSIDGMQRERRAQRIGSSYLVVDGGNRYLAPLVNLALYPSAAQTQRQESRERINAERTRRKERRP